MKRFYVITLAAAFTLASCKPNQTSEDATPVSNQNLVSPEATANTEKSIGQLVFKDQLCYNFRDEAGNTGDYEILFQPSTGTMYVSTTDLIPMIDGILIYPDATYKILGQNEDGSKVSATYKNGRDLVVELNDEEGIRYPKDQPYIDYRQNDGHSLVYRDGIKGSKESIKSKPYTITYERTGDYMSLHLTDAYPQLNARLLYGLAHLPGDAGDFFKRFGELWNISSGQWPTLIGGKDYSIEMTCFGVTDYHVDPGAYIEVGQH